MTKTLMEILKVMAIKASIVNAVKKAGQYSDNIRECPVYSELHGMEMTLKIMGIDVEYEFNADVTETIAIKAQGIRVEIPKLLPIGEENHKNFRRTTACTT